MPTAITCTGCRAPIDVPRDHADATIRCGICWTEVALFAKPAPAPVLPVAQPLPAKPVAQALPAKPAGKSSAGVPAKSSVAVPTAKPAAGMAKLEGLIQKAGAKLAGPAPAATVTPALPVAVLKAKSAEVVLPAIQPKPATPAAPVPIPQAPVPTPVRVPSSQPPVIVQPLPTAAPAVAVPVSEPVLAEVVPVPVTPVQPVPVSPPPAAGPIVVQGEVADKETKSSRRDDERSPYKRRRREDDDDDDDDRPRSRRGGKSSNGGLILMIVGGLALFVVLGVGGYYLSRPRTADPVPEVAALGPNGLPVIVNKDPGIAFNLPNADAAPQPAPNFNPFPNFPHLPQPAMPGRPPVQLNWAEYAGDGFKVKFGAPVREGMHMLRMQDDNFFLYHARGKVARTDTPPAARMEVAVADIPQGMNPDLKKIVAENGPAERVTPCQVAGKDGLEYQNATGWVTTTRLVQVGPRVFLFKFIGWDAFGDKASIEEAKKTFFDSISITYDPATPAPVDPALRPRKAPRVNPFPPGFGQMPNGGNAIPGFPPDPAPNFGGFPAAGTDALKLAGRIDPFLAAVLFPDRKEVYTVALRPGSRTQGELRRYEYPGFKLKNTYLLPWAGTFAVGSDKTDRLAITTLARTDGYVDGERSIVVGDVQVFDLAPIFADKTQQREELKPLATLPQLTGTRLAGLEMSPDGGTIYFATLAKGTTPAKPFKVRLNRADAATGKAIGAPLDLPEPVWRTRLSADGGRLFAAEVPLNAAGVPLHVKSTNVVTVDLNRWHVERTDVVAAGTAFDFVPLSSDSLIAAVIPIGGGQNFALWAVQQPAQATALDVPGQPPLSLGYVARTADGKRLVTSVSGGGRFGQATVEVYDVADWKAAGGFKRVASARVAKVNDAAGEPGVPVGHNFELTPDGQYAVFCETGAVVDLTAIGKK